MGHPIHKHMHTHITKSNVKAAIRDDKAHMDYLKRDVKDDQRAGGKYKDINQTADEKHISKLAGDVKYDEKKEGISRMDPMYNGKPGVQKDDFKQFSKGPKRESSKQEKKDLEKYNPVDDRSGNQPDLKKYKADKAKKKASSKKPGTREYGK